MTDEQRRIPQFHEIAPHLDKAGINISKLYQHHKLMICQKLLNDDYDIDTLDADDWEEIVAGLIEDHPTWETEIHRRRRHAQDIYESVNDYDMLGEDMDDYAGEEYAVMVADSGGRNWVQWCADKKSIAESYIAAMQSDNDNAEWIDGIYGLDTGDLVMMDVSMIVTCAIDNEVEVTSSN